MSLTYGIIPFKEGIMLKKLLSALIIISIACCACGKKETETQDTLLTIKQRDKLIIGVKVDTPPFGYLDKNGKNIGFDIDLAKLLAKKILADENKVVFVPVNTVNRIRKLSSGEVDMIIATMSVTPQRQAILDFSIPYHTAGQALMVKSGSKISSLMELSNKRAIVVFGSTVEKSLRTNVPKVKIIGYKTYPEAVKALKDNKAEAMISDDTILMGFAMNDPSLKILSKKYSKEPYAIAFRKEKESEDLIDLVNIELQEAINKGVIKQLKVKWGF